MLLHYASKTLAVRTVVMIRNSRARATGPSVARNDICRSEHRGGVLAAFLRRLPPRVRPDFAAYKAQFRLQPDLQLSDFALLAYTGAKLPSDGFTIVDTLEGMSPPCEIVLEVAGYRHYADKLSKTPTVGEKVELVAEPENKVDKQAIP
jgi:hypothetical protein